MWSCRAPWITQLRDLWSVQRQIWEHAVRLRQVCGAVPTCPHKKKNMWGGGGGLRESSWKTTKEYLDLRGTKIRILWVCFRAPFFPPFFPHSSLLLSYPFSSLHLSVVPPLVTPKKPLTKVPPWFRYSLVSCWSSQNVSAQILPNFPTKIELLDETKVYRQQMSHYYRTTPSPCAPAEARRWIFFKFLGGKFGGNFAGFFLAHQISACRKRSAAKGVRSLFFVFGTLSVTFRSLILMLLPLFLSLFCQTPFAGLLLRQGENK